MIGNATGPLDAEAILREAGAPLRLHVLEQTDSTNDELRRRLDADAVIAGRQTQGRGRLGRNWASPPGGVYISLRHDCCELRDKAPECLPAMALVVALGVFDGIGGLAPTARIKWPNDIICDAGKLVGILVEAASLGAEAVIGIGANVWRPAKDAEPVEKRAAWLAEESGMGAGLSREIVAGRILQGVCGRLREWGRAGYEFAAFKEAYEGRMAMLGEQAVVRNAEAKLLGAGRVTGVDHCGRLVLADGDAGVMTAVAAGEVTLR
jgi:BirA family biotin operon repressor/biotin-[acetyl-CoA-carboxylase] ligase